MKTRLRRMGNSYGITIPSHIRRLLWISPRNVLQMSTDGRRIVIEATDEILQYDEVARARQLLSCEGERPPPPVVAAMTPHQLEFDVHNIWLELERRFCMSMAALEALYHEPKPRIARVGGWFSSRGCATKANAEELLTIRRFRLCRDRLRAGDGWELAIETALRTFPKTATPPQHVAGTDAAARASST
ncbi:MAG TPA: AbrB/MazE/SpoVT family DNA-binding domain-containing protein [Kofleriaceae bacterium]